MKKVLATLVLALSINPILACDVDGKTGIVPENDMWIGPDVKGPNIMTQEEFNQVIDEVSAIYEPVFAAKKKKLVVERKWDSGTVNAYARQVGNKWMVSMFGGLARHKVMTRDGFAMVMCHEIGHHIGGAPKKRSWFFWSSWASNEGQSDYWAALKCMRRWMRSHPDQNHAITSSVDPHAKTLCQQQFNNEEDINICERSAMAGVALGNLFKHLRRQSDDLSLGTPDGNRVWRTDDGHPASQCRIDTYFAGALCNIEVDQLVSTTNYQTGTCSRKDKHTVGVRPRCWFRP